MDCQWFKTAHCRSCTLLDRSYEETLRLKERQLTDLFAGLSLHQKKTVGLPLGDAAESRSKVKLAVSSDSEGQLEFGLYDSGGAFKKLEECPLHLPGLNALLAPLKEKLREHHIVSYSLTQKKGELKYVILSKSHSQGDILLRFILRSKESLDRLKKMAKIFQELFPQVKVITANIQPEHKAVLEGEEEIVLSEDELIQHQFGKVKLSLGARSFFQVTPTIAAQLYGAVGDIVQRIHPTSFLDLYCGVGAFSYFAAQYCSLVMGVEISKEAIRCAESSRPLNFIRGDLTFKALDVEAFLKEEKNVFEAILVNPPRRGLNASIVAGLLSRRPQVIIYSSCNVETLRRDYELIKEDYGIDETTVFDMFPFTEHFETLMVFKRKI